MKLSESDIRWLEREKRFKQMISTLKPCPICGKKPKAKIDYGYEMSCFGGWVTIQCKPFLRKPHMRVEQGKCNNERALQYAVKEWNERVENENQENYS